MTNNGVEYTPIAITRGKISVSGTLDKSQMEVRSTINNPLAEIFRVYPPSQVVNIVIYQGHLSDPDAQFLVAWSGRVVSARRENHELILACEPVSTSLKRVGLRRHYQYTCMHVLYGDQCRASKVAATKAVIVQSVDAKGSTVVLAEGWETDARAPKYLNGLFEWINSAGDLETRTILRVTNNRELLLAGYARDLSAGMSANAVLGCNHGLYKNANGIGLTEETDCYYLHNNMRNFGGCAFIPTVNPVGLSNHFY
ncbi:hypothetical protein WKW50_16505 [Ochrobactrum sp. GPK 3]